MTILLIFLFYSSDYFITLQNPTYWPASTIKSLSWSHDYLRTCKECFIYKKCCILNWHSAEWSVSLLFPRKKDIKLINKSKLIIWSFHANLLILLGNPICSTIVNYFHFVKYFRLKPVEYIECQKNKHEVKWFQIACTRLFGHRVYFDYQDFVVIFASDLPFKF